MPLIFKPLIFKPAFPELDPPAGPGIVGAAKGFARSTDAQRWLLEPALGCSQ